MTLKDTSEVRLEFSDLNYLCSYASLETNSIKILRSVFNTVLEYYSLGGRY